MPSPSGFYANVRSKGSEFHDFESHGAGGCRRWRFEAGEEAAPETEAVEEMAGHQQRQGKKRRQKTLGPGRHHRLDQQEPQIEHQRTRREPSNLWIGAVTGALQPDQKRQVEAKQRWNKIEGRAGAGMQTELFGPASSVSEEHPAESSEGRAGPAVDNKLRIVNQFRALLLQFIHEGIFFVRIERLIKATELAQSLPARHEVAEDQFLFVAGASSSDGIVAGPARPEQPPHRYA